MPQTSSSLGGLDGFLPSVVYLMVSIAALVVSMILLVATIRYIRRQIPHRLVTMDKVEVVQHQQSLARTVTPNSNYQLAPDEYWTSTSPDIFETGSDASGRGKASGEAVDKLTVDDIDASVTFYSNRNLLRVKISGMDLACKGVGQQNGDGHASSGRSSISSGYDHSSYDEVASTGSSIKNIKEDIFVYVIVSLEPDYPAIHESDMRPIADKWRDMVSEFDIHIADIPSMTLHMSVHACDRFSQHRHLKNFIYNMNYIDTIKSNSVKPIILSRIHQ